MLLTRSPLSPGPKPWFSLDLHVLSAPPAFVLSQDQTLREGIDCPEGQNGSSFELVLKGHVQNGRDEVVSQPGSRDERSPANPPVSTFNAVEFSKTEPLDGGNKKASDSHQRPSGSRYRGRIRSLEGAPFVE